MSYIVKNCPAITEYKFPDKVHKDCCQCRYGYCKDINCVIKQVIEKCKERSNKCERCKASEDYQPTDCLDYCSNDDAIFADNILELFDIEEINK